MTRCRRCKITLKPGIALIPTLSPGLPDFEGDTHVSTFTYGGPGKIVPCLKCPQCGWSIAK